MTREEAGEKLEGFRWRMERAQQGERGSRRIGREDYGRIEAQLNKTVAESKISEKDARARLQGMRNAMAGQRERGDDKTEMDWEAIKWRIEGAVKSGDMRPARKPTRSTARSGNGCLGVVDGDPPLSQHDHS